LDAVEDDDLRVDAARLQLRNPLLGRTNRLNPVVARVHGEHRDAPRHGRWCRRSRDWNRSTEAFRVFVAPIPRPLSAHAEAGDDHLLRIDRITLFDRRQQRVDSPLVRWGAPSAAKRVWRYDDRAKIAEGRLDENFQHGMAGTARVATEMKRQNERYRL